MVKKIKIFLAAILIFSIQFTCVFAYCPTIESKAQNLVKKGWIKGRGSSNNLDLDKTITRAEVAKIICSKLKPKINDYKSYFTDIKPDFWAANCINFLAENNYISGYSDGTFRPNNTITYEELLAILVQIIPNWNENLKQEDIKYTGWARKYIYSAEKLGLLKDVNITNFKEKAKRGLAFAIFDNWDFVVTDMARNKVETNKYKSYDIATTSGKKNVTGCYLDFEDKLLELVNKERTSRGLKPLKKGISSLDRAATVRAREITYLFEHEKPCKKDLFKDIDNKEYKFTLGENIASGQLTPEAVIKSWMKSPGHRENILRENFNSVSQKCFKDEDGTYYWVQVFAVKRDDTTDSKKNNLQNQPKLSNKNKYIGSDKNYFVIELKCPKLNKTKLTDCYIKSDELEVNLCEDFTKYLNVSPEEFDSYEIISGDAVLSEASSYEHSALSILSPCKVKLQLNLKEI